MVSSFNVPTEPLLGGKPLEFSLRDGSKEALLLLHPCDADGRKEILLFLSYEDTSTWDKNLKLSMVFQLLEHTDILDTIMSSLDLLPPRIDAVRPITREFARELLTREKSYSPADPSSMSMWCIHTARRCNYSSTMDKGRSAAATSGRPQLPLRIIRVDVVCFTLLPFGSSDTPPDGDLPLRLVCHIAPDLVPETYSEDYNQIEPQTLQELLPKAANEGEPACKGNWWCPGSSTYLSLEPEISVAPPTLQQLYLMENPQRAL